MTIDWRKYWWQPGFVLAFFAVGVPCWLWLWRDAGGGGDAAAWCCGFHEGGGMMTGKPDNNLLPNEPAS